MYFLREVVGQLATTRAYFGVSKVEIDVYKLVGAKREFRSLVLLLNLRIELRRILRDTVSTS